MDIPLKIVQAGLVNEFVELKQRIGQLKKKKTEAYNRCNDWRAKLQSLSTYNDRGYIKSPVDMTWLEVLGFEEAAKELIEARGNYEEVTALYEEATDLEVALYHKVGMRWEKYEWV